MFGKEKTFRYVSKEEQKRMRENIKPDERNTFMEVAAVLFGVLLVIAIAVPAGQAFMWRWKADEAISDARDVNRAVLTVAYDYEDNGKAMMSKGTANGLTKEAEAEIMSLAYAPGTLEYLQYDSKNHQVTQMRYRNGDLIVVYDGQNQAGNYSVYRMQPIVKYKDPTK